MSQDDKGSYVKHVRMLTGPGVELPEIVNKKLPEIVNKTLTQILMMTIIIQHQTMNASELLCHLHHQLALLCLTQLT